jgi:EAL domain-containing protein (putative c-di-GMP-specific phosphodiesterase class I)/GGDEF domain-containing protein
MSLFKQIQLLVVFLLLAMLTVVLRINFENAREFTTNQTFNNAKNVANVLALSLHSRSADQAYIQTSINAMFDGGSFETIRLTRFDGTEVYKKSEALTVDGVPPLFIQWVRLQIPVAEAQVMDGWSVFGALQVKGHAGQAYKKLWMVFRQLCLLFALLSGVVMVLSWAILKHMLKALEKIQHQAEAISNNAFIVNPDVPRTPELKKVVLAMNAMVAKVQTIYNRQLEQLVKYKELRDKDAITGLHNRGFFIKALTRILCEPEPDANGQVVLLALSGMAGVNALGGEPVANRIFKNIGRILEKETDAIDGSLVARLPREEFALVLPDTTRARGLAVAEAAVGGFLAVIRQETDFADQLTAFGGMAQYRPKDDLKTVLSKADYALSVARSRLPGTVEGYRREQAQALLGKSEWKELIEEALAEDRFLINAQSVMDDTGVFHREVFITMVDRRGEHHRAGLFMPMVKTLGMANRLDQYILQRTVRYIMKNQGDVFAVNVSTDFCTNRLTLPWLRQFLSDHQSMRNNLVLEIHENTLIQHPEICIDFAGLLNGLGYGFGIDQYTMSDASLNLLDRLKPRYVKIERDDLEVFDDPEMTDMVLNALFTIADSLDIRLIATKVENEAQRLTLAARNIHHFQGRGIAPVGILNE